MSIVEAAYQKLDKENKGYIDAESLTYFYKHCSLVEILSGKKLVSTAIKDFFALFDYDKSGKVEYNEFIQYYTEISFFTQSAHAIEGYQQFAWKEPFASFDKFKGFGGAERSTPSEKISSIDSVSKSFYILLGLKEKSYLGMKYFPTDNIPKLFKEIVQTTDVNNVLFYNNILFGYFFQVQPNNYYKIKAEVGKKYGKSKKYSMTIHDDTDPGNSASTLLNIDLWQKGLTNVAVIHEKTKIPDLNLLVSKVYTVYFSKELFDSIKTAMAENLKAGRNPPVGSDLSAPLKTGGK